MRVKEDEGMIHESWEGRKKRSGDQSTSGLVYVHTQREEKTCS